MRIVRDIAGGIAGSLSARRHRGANLGKRGTKKELKGSLFLQNPGSLLDADLP
jgi:hypothetical protein